jgi:hypothetical protein
MKAEIVQTGNVVLIPENGTEAFALERWAAYYKRGAVGLDVRVDAARVEQMESLLDAQLPKVAATKGQEVEKEVEKNIIQMKKKRKK